MTAPWYSLSLVTIKESFAMINIGAVYMGNQCARFRVWAPKVEGLSVRLVSGETSRTVPLQADANGYFVGTINRVSIEPLGDDDFYGQSYFVDPRGQFVGDVGDPHDEELIVRDLDLDKIEEVRQTWQFFRDRRPDAYDDLVRP